MNNYIVEWEPEKYKHLFGSWDLMAEAYGLNRITIGQAVVKRKINEKILNNLETRLLASTKNKTSYRKMSDGYVNFVNRRKKGQLNTDKENMAKIKNAILKFDKNKDVAKETGLTCSVIHRVLNVFYGHSSIGVLRHELGLPEIEKDLPKILASEEKTALIEALIGDASSIMFLSEKLSVSVYQIRSYLLRIYQTTNLLEVRKIRSDKRQKDFFKNNSQNP